jgi:transposase
MTPYREILRLNGQGLSQRIIADTQHCARNTVASTISLALKHGLLLPLPTDLTDEKIGELFYPKREAPLSNRKMPDYEYIHSELARNGVTLSLLWTEYCADCKTSGEIPFMYTQFCYHYRGFVERKKATMHIDRKPGDIMEVDWAGDTATITDSTTGTEYPAYIFVAALPYSQYAYVEAFTTQDEEAWISAHVSSYKHFGGVTRILVCDNLKTGVDKNTNTETAINHAYQEMSEYYGTAIIPARVRKPRDYLQKNIIFKNGE